MSSHVRHRPPVLYTVMLGGGQRNAYRFTQHGWPPLDSVEHRIRVAETAERAGLHAVFMGDSMVHDAGASVPRTTEPFTLLSAIAARTSRIGLIGTFSTTFNHPYTIARQLASLAEISGGRAGANLVTSFAGERNFGLAEIPHPEERYARAREFQRVLVALLSSWRPETARVLGPGTVRADPIGFSGTQFEVEGPLDLRAPDVLPGLGQSGSSPAGIEFGAGFADFVYTSQPTHGGAVAFAQSLDEASRRLRSDGRRPAILTGVIPIIGTSAEEAGELARALRNDVDFATGVRRVTSIMGDVDLSDIGPDERVPRDRLIPLHELRRRQGRAAEYYRLFLEEQWTLGQVVEHDASTNGHWTLAGTADEIADALVARVDEGVTDGYNFWPSHYPEGLSRLTDLLLPALQERGYFEPALAQTPFAAYPRRLRE